MKNLIVASFIASAAMGAWAQSAALNAPENTAPAPAEIKEKDDKNWAAGVDVEMYSAYIWRSAFSSDRAVSHVSVWGDWAFFDPLSLGFYVWQNNDMTGRRRSNGVRGEWNETDYNVHLGYNAWTSDDEACALKFEVGHEWYVYNIHGHYEDGLAKSKFYPTTYELYLRGEFANPILTPYFQASWDYLRVHGMYFELGLNKEKTLAEIFDSESDLLSEFTLSGTWSVNGGSKRYLSYLYAPRYRNISYDGEDEISWDEKDQKSGIGGSTVQVGLTWAPCEHFSLSLIGAYTAILNNRCAEGVRTSHDLGEQGEWGDHRNLVWGGLKASVSF